VFGVQVLFFNVHRSLAAVQVTESRYTSGFPEEFRATMKAAQSVNILLTYGIDIYDYYMLLGTQTKLSNKAAVLPDAINIAIVRPFALLENPYYDPRIPVRMKEPFPGGFQYVGKVRPQPGSEFNLGFANNKELSEGGKLDTRSSFLIFDGEQVRAEAGFIFGYMHHISNPEVRARTRYRFGWRDEQGHLAFDGDWKRGEYAAMRLPGNATALVVQAAFDGNENEGMAEWPIHGFDMNIVARLNEGLARTGMR